MEKGPRLRGDRRPKGTPLTMGFTMVSVVHGSLERDAGFGDGREDPPRVFRSEEADQGDLPRTEGFAEGRAKGSAVGGDGISLRTRRAAVAADRAVAGRAGSVAGVE